MDKLLVQDFHFISCELISQLVVRDDRMLCCISIDVIAVLDQSCFQKSTCLTDIYVPPDHPEMSNIYIIISQQSCKLLIQEFIIRQRACRCIQTHRYTQRGVNSTVQPPGTSWVILIERAES